MFLRILLLITGITFTHQFAFSQSSFPIISHVTKDSVYIKWVPKNIQQFYAILENGVSVSISNNPNDFSASTKVVLPSVTKLWEKWDLTQEKLDRIHEIQFGVISAISLEKKAQDYAFTMASIEASLSFEMNTYSNLLIRIPRPKENSFSVMVEIKEGDKATQTFQNTVTPFVELPKLSGKVDQKKTATITWNADSVNTQYLGYQIERKIDKGKFEPLLDVPYVDFKTNAEKADRLASFRDEKLEAGKTYTYKIYGINYFGLKGKYSNEVSIYLPILTNAYVIIDTVKAKGFDREILVSIEKELDSIPLNVSRLVLMRSDSLTKGYTKVEELKVEKGKTSFIFKTNASLLSGDRSYFKVFAFSQDNDTAYSTPYYYFTLDQEPPQKITNIKGFIDSNGVVNLNWLKPKDNDLLGYRVFRANDKSEEFVERTSQLDLKTTFSDTMNLNTLTNEVYYFIVAVDQNYNNGPNSDTILVIKPDTIPPSEPFIITIKKSNNKVALEWQNSTSKDVQQSFLLRTTDNKVDTLLRWKKDEAATYLDSTFLFSKEINYSISAIDQSENRTTSKIKSITIESGFRPALTNVKAIANRTAKQIEISWTKPEIEVFQYFIYRKKGNGTYHLIKTVANADILNCVYIDKTVSISNDYEYLITYQAIDGFRSLKHPSVTIRY